MSSILEDVENLVGQLQLTEKKDHGIDFEGEENGEEDFRYTLVSNLQMRCASNMS